jgi:hypothetical protein
VTERHSLIAFCTLVGAICYLATIAALLAFYGKYAEALGFGGLTTGLVGVLGTFRPKSGVEPAGTPTDPISTTQAR